MNITSANLDIEESEFDFADIESCPSFTVLPRSVKESPIRYECSLREVVRISDLATGGSVILLDVKCIYVRDDAYEGGTINQQSLKTVGKLGGDYFSLRCKNVELHRP